MIVNSIQRCGRRYTLTLTDAEYALIRRALKLALEIETSKKLKRDDPVSRKAYIDTKGRHWPFSRHRKVDPLLELTEAWSDMDTDGYDDDD